MANEGEPITTGCAFLDRQFRRGGVPPGRVIVLGGPPFSGKTTLMSQILWHMSQVVPVFALFSDEGRTQAAIRFGVQAGVPLAEIEAKPSQAAEQFRDLMGERTILLMKPDTETSTIAGLVRKARADVPPGMTATIGLDSIQTIPLGLGEEETNPRMAAKRAMSQIRKWAAEYGYIFILTSQSNRASYRNRKTDENSIAMTSFAESGAIEFMCDVALVLSVPDDSGLVKVEFVKNRLKGTMVGFPLRYSELTGRMGEEDAVIAAETKTNEKKELDAKLIGELQDQIIIKLRKLGLGRKGAEVKEDGVTRRQILDLVGSRYDYVKAAIEGLVSQGALIEETGKRNSIIVRLKEWTEN